MLRCKRMVNEVRKSTSLAVIPIQTIVFKSFSLAFLVLLLPRLKENFIGMHSGSRKHAVQHCSFEVLID